MLVFKLEIGFYTQRINVEDSFKHNYQFHGRKRFSNILEDNEYK